MPYFGKFCLSFQTNNIPESNKFKIVFPLRSRIYYFEYDRTLMHEDDINNKFTIDEVYNIPRDCEYSTKFFIKQAFVRFLNMFSFFSMLVLLIVGMTEIILDSMKKLDESKAAINDPNSKLLPNTSTEISDHTLSGIFFLLLGVFQYALVYLVYRKIRKTTQLQYTQLIEDVLNGANTRIFNSKGLRWMNGEQNKWIEMKLDYLYEKYHSEQNGLKEASGDNKVKVMNPDSDSNRNIHEDSIIISVNHMENAAINRN